MAFTRRDTLAMGSAALVALGFPGGTHAQDMTAEQAMSAFADGARITEGGVQLSMADIAEDGYKVPVEVVADGAAAILIIAPANPVPPVALVTFGPQAADHRFATRIRLARTQEVIALARLTDGTVHRATQQVDVVVGGCGA